MRAIIIGASGTIGKRLTALFLKHGHDVVGVSRNKLDIENAKSISINDYDQSRLESILQTEPHDCIIHLSALGTRPGKCSPIDMIDVNSVLPSRVVVASSKTQKKPVLITGTNAEYRDDKKTSPFSESEPLTHSGAYGSSKAAGGLLALQTGDQLDIPVAVARLFNIYGPGDHSLKLLPSLVNHLSKSQKVPLSGGEQVRDFLYIDDACEALFALAQKMTASSDIKGYFNVCTGIETTIKDFALLTAEVLNQDPALLDFGALPYRDTDVFYSVGDPSRMKAVCDWKAQYNLLEGIRKFCAK